MGARKPVVDAEIAKALQVAYCLRMSEDTNSACFNVPGDDAPCCICREAFAAALDAGVKLGQDEFHALIAKLYAELLGRRE